MSQASRYRVLARAPGWTRHRVCRWCPRYGSLVMHTISGTRRFYWSWKQREGWWCYAVGVRGAPAGDYLLELPRPREVKMKRRAGPPEGGVILPALPATSVVFAKFPGIREFLTATSYEDGTPRQCGYLTARNRSIAFEITLYDPDSGTRCSVRAAKWDEVWAAAEHLLGVEEAPWEPDTYLTRLLMEKKKPRKKAT